MDAYRAKPTCGRCYYACSQGGVEIFLVDSGTIERTHTPVSVTGTVTFDTVLDTIMNSTLTFTHGGLTHGGTPAGEFGKQSVWDYVATSDGRLLFHQKIPSEPYHAGGLEWYFDPLPWATYYEALLSISTTTDGKPFLSLAYGVLSLDIDVDVATIYSSTADVLIGTVTVPEPSTFLMAMTALALMGGRWGLHKGFKIQTA
jgi:hypothetical protein